MINNIKIFILSVFVAFAFSACNHQKKTDETATSNETTTTPDDNPTIQDSATADMNKQAGETAGKNVIYTCKMHPEVRSDKPGKCPKCGMDLVVKK